MHQDTKNTLYVILIHSAIALGICSLKPIKNRPEFKSTYPDKTSEETHGIISSKYATQLNAISNNKIDSIENTIISSFKIVANLDSTGQRQKALMDLLQSELREHKTLPLEFQ